MKTDKKFLIVPLIGILTLSITACSKESSETADTESSSSSYVQTYSEYDGITSVNDTVVTTSNYYDQAPAASENTGNAEGSVPDSIPEGTATECSLNEEMTFTENGSPAYSVTITNAEFTDRRSTFSSETADKVILVTYSFCSKTDNPALVDDMSFRMVSDAGSCTPYYPDDLKTAEVSENGSAVTAEVAYSVPSDTKSATLYVVDNAVPDNETYKLELQF